MRKEVFRYLFAVLLVFGLFACDNGGPGKEDFIVTFDLSGGNIEGDDASVEIIVKSGETIAVLPNPQKGTDNFDGWFSDENGKGTQFTAETVVASNLTVYAKWTPVTPSTFTVTFNSNGGSNVSAISGIASGATITLPSAPTKTGNTFSGWYTDDTTFLNEFTAETAVTQDLTVYAKWTPVTPGTYTVTFNSNGGTSVSAIGGIASGATITLPAAPTKTGNTFSGWYTDDTTFLNAFTSTTPVTQNITVYAKWTLDSGRVFILKDIPSEYNGKWAVIAENVAGLKVAGAQSIDMSNEKMIGAPVSGGTAQIPMWIIDGNETSRYTGSDSGKFGVWIYEKETVPFDVSDDPDLIDDILLEISFSNGGGQKSYNDRTYDTGSLSVSGLGKYSGKYIFALAFLGSGENADALFAAESFDHDETFTNGLIDTSGNITLNVYKGTNTGSGFSIGGYKYKDAVGRIDMLILSKPTFSLTDLSEVLPVMSDPDATADEKAAAAGSIGLIYTVSHNPAGDPHFVDGAYDIGSDWEQVEAYGKVVITGDVYQFESDVTRFTDSVAEITARIVNPENTEETIEELGIVGSIKDGVLTIELPAELDDSFLYTDVDGTNTGEPGSKIGWIWFSPFLVLNKYWGDWEEDSDWMGTMPIYFIDNENNAEWVYLMRPTDHPEDGFIKPTSDQDELIADGFYWQIRD